MRKLVLIFVLTFSIAGCAGVPKALFVGVDSPITADVLYQTENLMTVAFAGLNAYKRSCNRGVIPPSCKETIKDIQVYTRQVPPLLRQVRSFVRSGDQVNAKTAFRTLQAIVNTVKAIGVEKGVAL